MTAFPSSDSRGFSLVEMAMVVLVLGLVLAIGVGGFHSLSSDQSLIGAAQGIAGQVQLARARAMSTGTTQTVNFGTSTTPAKVFVIGTGGTRSWSLPRNVHFATGGASSFNMTSDGRASTSTYIVLLNDKGVRDTISVETSGLVIVR